MSAGYRKVAFLDTNALHFVDLYLKRAEIACIYPFVDDAVENDNAIDEAKTWLGSVSEEKFKEALGHGLNVLSWISKEDLSVEYSPLTELELMTGRLKGRALQDAAAEGIPDRMWGRFPEDEIAARLALKDFQEVRTAVDGLGVALENLEIEVAVSAEHATDVMNLAKRVAGLVYMGAMDCVIYSHALVAQADYLITNDRYLRNTVNRIRSKTSHREINARLREIVGRTTATLGDSSDVVLPEARWPKDHRSSDSSKSDA